MENGKDYYIVNKNGVEFRVLLENYLAKRGWCCGNNCLFCPYTPKTQKGNTLLRDDVKKKLDEDKYI
jgi:2-iminoacetate synthase ThiH